MAERKVENIKKIGRGQSEAKVRGYLETKEQDS